MPRDRRFDQAQFERILRRAVELQAEQEEQHFTEADVVAAGRELGIRDELTRAAVRELSAPRITVERPAGTDVTIEADEDSLRLIAPPRSHGWVRKARVGMAALFVTVASLFSYAAAQENAEGLATLFFAILFWWIALRFIGETLEESVERTELVLRGATGQLVRRWGAYSRSRELVSRQLRFYLRGATPATRAPAYLELQHGSQRYKLLPWRSLPELRWVEASLSAWQREHAPESD